MYLYQNMRFLTLPCFYRGDIMRFIEYAKNMEKPVLYDSYQRIYYDCKNYNKVTRTTMAKEIIDYYLEDNYFFSSIITDNELDILKRLLNGKNKIEKAEDFSKIFKLQQKCIVYGDDTDSYYIFDEFVEPLEKIKNSKRNRNDDFLYLALGILKAIGTLPYHVYIKMLSQFIKDNDSEMVKKFLESQAVFQFEIYLYDDPQLKTSMISYSDYLVLDDEIKKVKGEKAMGGNLALDINLFKDLYADLLPNCLKETKELYKAIDNEHVIYACAVGLENARITADIESVEKLIELFDDDNTKKIIMNLFKKLPSPALNGRTYEQWQKTKKEVQEAKKSLINEIQTSKSLLKPYQVQRFYDAYLSLIAYTNKNHKVVKKDLSTLVNNHHFDKKKFDKYIVKVDEYIWNNPKIIDEYLRDNPYNMSQKDLALIRSFKKFKTGLMVICGYHNDGTEILDVKERKIYFVKGLGSKIVEVVGGCRLPLLVEMTLVPYEDVITYTGYINKITIDVGSELVTEINEVKKQTKIIKRF